MIKFKTLRQNLKSFEKVIIKSRVTDLEEIATKAIFDKQKKNLYSLMNLTILF